MIYRGRIKRGVVILDDRNGLPEGTEVTVRPVKVKAAARARKKGRAVAAGLLKLAGKARGLPHDAARNVDHYLYGHRKR